MLAHLDTDFLIHALSRRGPHWDALLELAQSEAAIGMSSIAWYEFSRGPRNPEQMARAGVFLGDDGIVPFSEILATRSAEVFRLLGSPRRRGNDIAIGVTAASMGAVLFTNNSDDFVDIPELRLEVVEIRK